MKLFRLEDMTRGWFVGGFTPTAHYTKDFEVAYQNHAKGEIDHHFHTTVTEVNLVVSGKMRIQDKELGPGDIFILEAWEITNPDFIEDTSIVCVKFPSMNDKRGLALGN